MIFNQNFISHLLGCLKDSEYLLFEHFAIHKPIPEIPFNILLRKNDHQKVIDGIKEFSEIGVSSINQKKSNTELAIAFKDGSRVELVFWNSLSQDNITYLDVERVFLKKQRSKSEFYMPNIEHLFEFAILHHFLNNKGLARQYLSYFEDFHFFVKDGLLEFFNQKYNTDFSNLDELSNFKIETKESIVNELKKLPNNQFLKKINMQWKNLWGSGHEVEG